MALDLHFLLGGLFLGALYGTAAVGFQLVLGSTGRVHLAYGHAWVAWALALTSLLAAESVPPLPALAVLPVAGAVVGWALHPARLWRGPPGPESARAFCLLTLGAALVLEDLGGRLWPLSGTAAAWAPPPVLWGGMALPPAKLVLLAAALATGLGVHLLLRHNRWGKALVAWDRGAAPVWLVGVDPGALGRRAAAMGFAVSALAGTFLALSYTVSIREGMLMTVRALVLAVLGGTLSPLGVLGLGLGLGMGEAWVGEIAGMRWGPALGYGILLLLLPVLERRRP